VKNLEDFRIEGEPSWEPGLLAIAAPMVIGVGAGHVLNVLGSAAAVVLVALYGAISLMALHQYAERNRRRRALYRSYLEGCDLASLVKASVSTELSESSKQEIRNLLNERYADWAILGRS